MSDPRNREIGFVSSSFSFRAVRAVRASGRGEAVRAHVQRCAYRWASQVRVSMCVRVLFSLIFCAQAHGFNSFSVLTFESFSVFWWQAYGFYEFRV